MFHAALSPSRPLLLLFALVLAASAFGCGSDSSGTTTAATATEETTAARPAGGDNSIEEFGGEAPGSDRAAAAATLHAYLDARVADAWGAACKQLASGVSGDLVRQLGPQGGSKANCAEVVEKLTSAVPEAALREAAVADVGALRVEGDSGFLLFRGARGVEYFIPVAREGGEWKLAAIAASPLP